MKKKLRDLTQFNSWMSAKKQKSEKEKKKSHDETMKSVKNKFLKQNNFLTTKGLRKKATSRARGRTQVQKVIRNDLSSEFCFKICFWKLL